jgi:KUP system potassium uptake protein
VAIVIWQFNVFIILFFFLVFGCFDGVYLSSSLTKIPTGAWFTILLSSILSFIFVLWRFGKENQWRSEAEDRFQPSHLLTSPSSVDQTMVKLTPAFGGGTVSMVDGVGIFFDKVGNMVPIVFAQFVRKFCARPRIIVFFHLRELSTPSIHESERYIVQRTTIPGCYRMTARHGYTDSIMTPDLGRVIVEQLILFVTRDTDSTFSAASSKEYSPEVQAELEVINKGAEAQMTYIMGKEQMTIKEGTGWARRVWLMLFLWIRENSRLEHSIR